MKINTYAIAVSSFAVASVLNAAYVSESEATAVAAGFASRDKIGARVLGGMTLKEVSKRGNLWIASFLPSGHIIVNGTDLADPIVGFSVNDFIEPEPESPAYAMLDAYSSQVDALEESGGERNPRWDALQRSSTRMLLASADSPSSSAIVVEPFLQPHFNQWQPYNDYCPVYEANTNAVRFNSYRGRTPCGCVATAAAQIYKHFNWPARIDKTVEYDHTFNQTNETSAVFPLRFNGNAAFDWSAISTNYQSSTTNVVHTPVEGKPGYYRINYLSDLRGNVNETVRYPIARLTMWMDVNARMNFGPGGSSAWFGSVASAMSEWYTTGSWVDVDDARVVSDLQAGIPLAVGIQGHQVVGHGWASDGTHSYIYLNFGWGGSNDGYYNTDSSTISMPFQAGQTYVGHYPRAKPQIDPMPKVCGQDAAVTWRFPDIYTNNLEGFTVTFQKSATATSTFEDDFSSSPGVSDSSNIYIGTDEYSDSDHLLHVGSTVSGTYTYPDTYILTSGSVLTFKMLSFAALGAVFEVQAKFDDGNWETVATPLLQSAWGSSGWCTKRIYLGRHGGKSARFRFRNSRNSGSYYSGGRIIVDDLKLTNVLAPEPAITSIVSAETRSLAIPGDNSGTTFMATVEPIISAALVEGETSDSISLVVEGESIIPIPGEESYASSNCTFPNSNQAGDWTYDGTLSNEVAELSGPWNCYATCHLIGTITQTSSVSFSWQANEYYGNDSSYDVISVVFTDEGGAQTTIASITNTAVQSNWQNVECSLSDFAGSTGKIRFGYFHNGGGYKRGGKLGEMQVRNISYGVAPEPEYETIVHSSLGMPSINSISHAGEGFFSECGVGTSTFTVNCSSSVTTLTATCSHPSLVSDGDITVKGSSGYFKVSIAPSGINESNYRSRVILTIAATDSNGTTTYKDLSLRFSPVEASEQVATVTLTASDGTQSAVSIPADWFETYGLSYADDDKDTATGLNGDFDNDGLSNWAEYVCGTSPTDAEEKLECTIDIIDGVAKVEYSPKTLRSGYKTILRGTDDLGAALKDWTVVTTETSTLHFYRVEIVPE